MNWHIIRQAGPRGDVVNRVAGQVFGHPRFASGHIISTSRIARYRLEAEAIVITTRSGSEYVLGKPLASEPFAMRRLIRYLDEQAALCGGGDSDVVTQQLAHPDGPDNAGRSRSGGGQVVDTYALTDTEVLRG